MTNDQRSALRKLASEATQIDERRDALLVATASMSYLARLRLADVGELAAAVPDLLDQLDRAEAALSEREADMHMRIRAGYDKTVADSWRSSNATLEAQLSTCRAALGEVTAARDEACDRLEAVWNRLYLKSEMAEVGDGGVTALRSVGQPK